MLDCKGNYGNTALHIAVHCGRVEMTRYLLKKGFDVNKQNELSETPLHLAAGYGSHYATGTKIQNILILGTKGTQGDLGRRADNFEWKIQPWQKRYTRL